MTATSSPWCGLRSLFLIVPPTEIIGRRVHAA